VTAAGRPTSRRPGPRGAGDARAAIHDAAARLFANRGYAGTTLRAVADAAGVDVALVPYYFGSKSGLFAAVAEMPANPVEIVREVLDEGLDGAGRRIVRAFLGVWEHPDMGAALQSLFRASVADPVRAQTLGQFLDTDILSRYRAAVGGPHADLRAALAANMLIGLAVSRYILHVNPEASMTVDEVVDLVGPVLQDILTGGPLLAR